MFHRVSIVHLEFRWVHSGLGLVYFQLEARKSQQIKYLGLIPRMLVCRDMPLLDEKKEIKVDRDSWQFILAYISTYHSIVASANSIHLLPSMHWSLYWQEVTGMSMLSNIMTSTMEDTISCALFWRQRRTANSVSIAANLAAGTELPLRHRRLIIHKTLKLHPYGRWWCGIHLYMMIFLPKCNLKKVNS